MSFRNTIVALVLFAIIGGYAYLSYRGNATEQTQRVFPSLDQKDISGIDLKYPDREIELAKVKSKGDKWFLTKPIAAEADQTAADNLAHAIAQCELKKTVEEKPASLDPF